MQQRISGKSFVFGDHINSDIIIAGRYLIYIEPEKLAEHAFEMLGDGYPEKLKGYEILVAGRNFGGGSAREQAATALIGLGFKAVVATSFARTFYRNAINVGLPAIECPELHGKVAEGDAITIDMGAGTVEHGGASFGFPPLPESLRELLELGGLAAYLKTQVEKTG